MNKSKVDLKNILTWRVIVSVGLVLCGILFFAYIADEAVIEKEKMFDNWAIGYFNAIASTGLISTMKVFTFFGSTAFLIPYYTLLMGYFCIKKNYLFVVYILITTLGSTALFAGLKLIFHRPRPLHPLITGLTGYSFPSGHSLSACVISGILLYIVWSSILKISLKQIFSFLLVLFAVAIGISRIVLNAHYPTDVIASFSVGIAWVIISLQLLFFFKSRRSLEKTL